MISDNGAVTSFTSFVSVSCHFIFIDIESLPTGIEMPSRWQRRLTASTALYIAAPSPGWLFADIQFAESLTWCSLSGVSATVRFIKDSATAMQAEALGLINASEGFSPIAIHSPVFIPGESEVAVTETSETGTCHGPTI